MNVADGCYNPVSIDGCDSAPGVAAGNAARFVSAQPVGADVAQGIAIDGARPFSRDVMAITLPAR